jgi:hypothetical protein
MIQFLVNRLLNPNLVQVANAVVKPMVHLAQMVTQQPMALCPRKLILNYRAKLMNQ